MKYSMRFVKLTYSNVFLQFHLTKLGYTLHSDKLSSPNIYFLVLSISVRLDQWMKYVIILGRRQIPKISQRSVFYPYLNNQVANKKINTVVAELRISTTLIPKPTHGHNRASSIHLFSSKLSPLVHPNYYHPSSRSPSQWFPKGFPTKILCSFLVSSILDFTLLTTLDGPNRMTKNYETLKK
jgi:hypothetical protein